VPTLCVLNGIAIRMNTRDHPPPHFHAYFGEHQVRIEIANLAVMTGRLPRPQQRLLLRWSRAHQRELMRNWELAQAGLPHEPISPELEEH
jgi:Domain of unknown function (DUF4160)